MEKLLESLPTFFSSHCRYDQPQLSPLPLAAFSQPPIDLCNCILVFLIILEFRIFGVNSVVSVVFSLSIQNA